MQIVTAARREFELRGADFDSQQMRTLKPVDRDGLYTNLALLLSDQCMHSLKVAVFQGTDQTHATIEGLLRKLVKEQRLQQHGKARNTSYTKKF